MTAEDFRNYSFLAPPPPPDIEKTQSVPEEVRKHAAIVGQLHDTFRRKNHDYGNSFSELYAEVGMPYAYGHMAEKLKRVKTLMRDEAQVQGESMRDSLLDLANYAILTVMELDKR